MNYTLLIVSQRKTLQTTAPGRREAIADFGKELGCNLSLEGDGPPAYLLDEWEGSPHWVNPTIPVFDGT